jgi:hypothetical protein
VSHADVLAAITARGGRLVASFTIDKRGDVLGAGSRPKRQHQRRKLYSCTGCGAAGHSTRRCNGPGNPPRPTSDERRRAEKGLP